jgi:cell division protein FtsI (penicillin-binding protein 3)
MLAMAGIVIRLAVLQVRESGTYAELGSTQRVHTEPLPALRGEMLDRSGVPMALTLEARDVYANPSLVVDASTEADQVARVLGLQQKDVRAALSTPGSGRSMPTSHSTWPTCTFPGSASCRWPSVTTRPDPWRPRSWGS